MAIPREQQQIPGPQARVLDHAAGDERSALEAFLDYYRDVVIRKVTDMGQVDLRKRWVGSPTTLGGLIKHLAVVERTWFGELLGGRPTQEGHGTVRTGFELEPDDSALTLVRDYVAACQESRAVAASSAFTDTAEHPVLGAVSVRWIQVHRRPHEFLTAAGRGGLGCQGRCGTWSRWFH